MTESLRFKLIVFCIITGILLNLQIAWAFSNTGGDFIQDYESAKAFLARGSLYKSYPHPHPPLLVLLYLPFVLLPVQQSFMLFELLSLVASWLFCDLIGKALLLSREQKLSVFALLLFWPEYHAIAGLGTITAVVSFFIAAFAYLFLQKKDYWAGALLAVAAALKIYPAAFLLIPLAQSRSKTILGFALTFIAIHLILLPFIGVGSFKEWFTVGVPFAQQFIDNPVNLSLVSYIDRLVGSPGGYREPVVYFETASMLSKVLLPIFGFTLIFAAALRLGKSDRSLIGVIGLAFTLLLITEPMTWGHYLMILTWPIAWVGFDSARRERAGILFLVTVAFLFGWEPATRFTDIELIASLKQLPTWTEGLVPLLGMITLGFIIFRELRLTEPFPQSIPSFKRKESKYPESI